MGTRSQNLAKEGWLLDIYGSTTGVGISRSPVRGMGTAFNFGSGILGRTLMLRDSAATVTTMKTITFTRANLGITGGSNTPPTLAQVVAALNSVLSVDAAKTVASAGPDGRLVITGVGDLTIGPGTANTDFGYPDGGVTVKHGTGITIVFPASMSGPGYTEHIYQHVPRMVGSLTYTPADGKQVSIAAANVVLADWTPATRTLLLTGGTGQSHIILEY
jgi:hypothetical protein